MGNNCEDRNVFVYHNHFVQAIAFLAYLGLAAGFVAFIVQVARWDSEYEDFLIFPLRFAIYLIPYLMVPGLGVIIGGLMMRSKKRVIRKIRGRFYICLRSWSTVFGDRPMDRNPMSYQARSADTN